jgi:hypothetical protein
MVMTGAPGSDRQAASAASALQRASLRLSTTALAGASGGEPTKNARTPFKNSIEKGKGHTLGPCLGKPNSNSPGCCHFNWLHQRVRGLAVTYEWFTQIASQQLPDCIWLYAVCVVAMRRRVTSEMGCEFSLPTFCTARHAAACPKCAPGARDVARGYGVVWFGR